MKTWADYIGKEVALVWRWSTPDTFGAIGTVMGADETGVFLACHNDASGVKGDLFLPWLSVKYISLTSKNELARRMVEGPAEADVVEG